MSKNDFPCRTCYKYLCDQACDDFRMWLEDKVDAVEVVHGMSEGTYQRIMNRLFFAAEGVCGNDMVDLETVGDVIREECRMDG